MNTVKDENRTLSISLGQGTLGEFSSLNRLLWVPVEVDDKSRVQTEHTFNTVETAEVQHTPVGKTVTWGPKTVLRRQSQGVTERSFVST